MQRHWKFHDYDMLLDHRIKTGRGEFPRFPVVYRLTHLPKGSLCLIYRSEGVTGWTRKTKNEGRNGSVRYISYRNLDEALDAGIKWARRKDEEAAEEGVK